MAFETFPAHFLWGAATASYQIEGAVHEGERGASIWDTFSHTPGRVLNGDTGDIACDHYHRYAEDIALMKSLGLQTYRFSIAWSRLFPNGSGALNQVGVDFYNRLTDGLLTAGLLPVPTLYHWDLPQTLEDAGGWTNHETAYRFADYADAVYTALGDRVHRFITLNEPWCSAHLGYATDHHAPGLQDQDKALLAGHTLLVAHGLAVQRFRASVPKGEIGITVNLGPAYPASDSEADRLAAQRWDAYTNRWFLDPIYKGDYPTEMREIFGDRLPHFTDEERALVQSPQDFCGVNYYTRSFFRDNPEGGLFRIAGANPADAPRTDMGLEIYPDGLFETLVGLQRSYGNPVLYVTENGGAFPDDQVSEDGTVQDEDRRVYLREHFRAAHRAISAGVRLNGYYVWSLMDNFEWAFGYTKRFGIVHVDYETQKRTPKKSANWYAQVIRQHGIGDD